MVQLLILCFALLQVSAINRAGQSNPSDPTAPLLVKALNAPPKIDRKVLGESQTVKVKPDEYFKCSRRVMSA